MWFERAGAAGVPQALQNLGKMLEMVRASNRTEHLPGRLRFAVTDAAANVTNVADNPCVESDIAPETLTLSLIPPSACRFSYFNQYRVYQGFGVEVDRERALKMYQAALRAEGHLEGELAKVSDDIMATVFEAKGKEFVAEKDKQKELGRGAPEPSKDEGGEPSASAPLKTASSV